MSRVKGVASAKVISTACACGNLIVSRSKRKVKCDECQTETKRETARRGTRYTPSIKPLVKESGKKKKRLCLRCDKKFNSLGVFNRICPECILAINGVMHARHKYHY